MSRRTLSFAVLIAIGAIVGVAVVLDEKQEATIAALSEPAAAADQRAPTETEPEAGEASAADRGSGRSDNAGKPVGEPQRSESGSGAAGGPGAGGTPAGETAASDQGSADAAPLDLIAPPDAYLIVWVRREQTVEIRTEPGGGELVKRVDRRTEFRSPTVFGVVQRSGDWAGISSASLPNGRLGWIRLDPKRLRAGWTRLSIVVDLSERRAALRAGDRSLRSFAVTIGMPGAETPVGRFSVTDTLRGSLNPAYGCCAVALSATQPHLPSGWLGGNRIAIHGTTGPLGVAASHGCVRAADADVAKLIERVPLGTPVFIRA